MSTYHAQFPSAHGSVGTARRAIVDFARSWFAGVELADIESAVGEALANCAEHGYRDDGVIAVTCRADGERLTIEIQDAGTGFERWNHSDWTQPTSSAPRGYGMFIMRRLMDEIEYSDRGTRLRLVKRLPRARAAESDACQERFG